MDSKSTITILHLATSGRLYGAETGLLQLVSALDKDRFRSVVVMPCEGPLKSRLDALGVPVEIVPSLRPWLTPRPGWQTPLYFLAVLPFVSASTVHICRIIERYQVGLVHTSSSVMIDAACAAKLMRVPHVWHVRELLVRGNIHHFVFGSKAAIRIIGALSDHVIAVSRFIAESLARLPSSRLTVVHNAGDVSRFRAADGHTIRQELDIPTEGILIGQIGRISPAKGLEYLIQAVSKIKHTSLRVTVVLAGSSSRCDLSYYQRLRKMIVDLDLEDCFKIVGFREDVPQIVKALDLMVLASVDEPFGRVVVEGMAAGKPVVATTVGGIPEIVEDGVTGLLVPPRDPEALADAVLDILGDPDRSRQMGAAGQRRALKLFGVERYVAEVEQVYAQVLTARH